MKRRLHLVLVSVAAAAAAVFVTGCGASIASVPVAGGDARDAPGLIDAYGCGACHTISGIADADGEVGPSLAGFASRRTIAGMLPNTPANLVRWIWHPQAVEPGTVMPDLGLSERDARDIAAYLYRH